MNMFGRPKLSDDQTNGPLPNQEGDKGVSLPKVSQELAPLTCALSSAT